MKRSRARLQFQQDETADVAGHLRRRHLLKLGVQGQLHVAPLPGDVEHRLPGLVPERAAVAAQSRIVGALDARRAEAHAVVADGRAARRQRVDARQRPRLADRLGQDDAVAVNDPAALHPPLGFHQPRVVRAGGQRLAAHGGPVGQRQGDDAKAGQQRQPQPLDAPGQARVIGARGHGPVVGRGQVEKQADHDAADQQRATAVADERQGDARQRQQLDDAADDEHGLDGEQDNQPSGQVSVEIPRAEALEAQQRRPQATEGDQGDGEDDGQAADQTPLFGNGRQGEVGVDDGDVVGEALARAAAEDAPGGLGIERLDDLIGPVAGVGPRVEPGQDARRDGVKGEEGEDDRGYQQDAAAHNVETLARSQIEQGDEDDEEQSRRPQVLLPDQQQQAKAPHEHQRPQEGELVEQAAGRVLARPVARVKLPLATVAIERLLLSEVAGQEDDQQQLQQFRRLEIDHVQEGHGDRQP